MSKQNILILISIIYILTVTAFFSNLTIPSAVILTLILSAFLCLRKITLNIFIVSLFIILLAIVNCSFKIKDNDELISFTPSNISLTARVISIPTTNNNEYTKFYANVSSINLDGRTYDINNDKTLITINDSKEHYSKIKIGDVIELKGRLTKPSNAQNPYQFDYSKYLRSKNTFTLFYSNSDEWKIISPPDKIIWKFLSDLNAKRTEIINKHSQNIKSPNLEILGGIVFGDDAVNPTDEIKQSFIDSGLLHILAASGMNVTLIFGIWFFISQRLRFNYKISILLGMAIIIFYTCMTGFGASILRAAIMLLFILLGKLIDKSTNTIALLFLVALLMLLYNPAMINDVGFQLSFIVTFGLVFSSEIFNNKIQNRLLNFCFVSGIVPLVAQLYAAPLQMYYFNTLSIYSVLANIMIIPVLSIVSFLGFISSILACFEGIAIYICKLSSYILNPLISWIVFVAELFSKMPHSTINIYRFGLFSLILYYSALILGTYLIINKTFELKHKITILLIITLFVLTFINIPSKNTEIIFFSVGNADSALIKSPDNRYFMIDTGRIPYKSMNSSAKQIILKYLRIKSINKLEALILTHFDADHTGGTIDILDNIETKTVYEISDRENTIIADEIEQYISQNKINTKIVADREVVYSTPNFTLTNYVNNNAQSENDRSIITLLEANGKRVVFMGDSSAKMIDVVPFENFDLIKIGHHGASETTDEKLANSVKYAIISTGFNQYGHPAKETLDNLKNTFYLRTDNNNAIKVVINDKITFYSYYPHLKRFIKVKLNKG